MKVFFDENFSKYLVYAINELEKPYGQIEVFATIDFMAGATDEDVIKHVANNNGVLFTRDNDFHKQKLLRDIINANSVGLVYFGMKNSTNWMQVRYVIYNWHLLRDHIIKNIVVRLKYNFPQKGWLCPIKWHLFLIWYLAWGISRTVTIVCRAVLWSGVPKIAAGFRGI